MSSTTRRSEWVVLGGVALVALGAWLLAERVFGWLFYPLSRVLHVLGNVGWPLVLVGLGVLLVMRGRNGGWTSTARYSGRGPTARSQALLGGAAVYFGIDSSLARLVYAVLTVLTGFWLGFIVYVIAMVVVPEEQYRVLGGRNRTGRSSGSVGADGASAASPRLPSPPATSSAV